MAKRESTLTGWIPRDVHPVAWKALGLSWLLWTLNAFDFMLPTILGPNIINEFGLTATAFTGLIALIYALRAIFDLPLAALSDRLGSGWRRRRVWVPLVLVYAVVSTLSAVKALSGSVGALFAQRAVVGVGCVGDETIGVTATSEWWPAKHRGFAIGLHHTGFPVGTFLAGQLSALVMYLFGADEWRLVFWFSLLSIPLILIYRRLSTAENFAKLGKHADQDDEAHPHETEGSVSADSPWWSVLKQREVCLAALYSGLMVIVYFGFSTTFPLYLAYVSDYSLAEVASLSVIWTLVGAVFQVVLPRLSDRVGRKPLLVFAAVWQCLVMAMVPMATSLVMVVLVQVAWGLVSNAIPAICYTVCADAAPPGRVATAVSFSTTFAYVCSTLALLGSGLLIDAGGGVHSASGFITAFWILSGISLVTGLMYFLLARETKPGGETPVRMESRLVES
ncbi:MFS transporter [Streptomyces sp. NPDC059894]|uniref:MFS transporter n=1 Tax=unclassified Streptomyces TaxID=2593676 RepID=UPI003653781F